MSINYLDLIRNPEKLGKPAGNGDGKVSAGLRKVSEAVIPPNTLDAKKNEWRESKQLNVFKKPTSTSNLLTNNLSSTSSSLHGSFSSNDSVSKRNIVGNGPTEAAQAKRSPEKRATTAQPLKGTSDSATVLKSNSSFNSQSRVSKQEMLRVKYALKAESKADYKKFFSKVVREYNDTENRFFDANQTQKSTYLLQVCLVILLTMVFFHVRATRTPKFCGNGISADTTYCQSCPSNAVCLNSVMRCKEGYLQQGFSCVLNPKIISNAEKFLDEKIAELQLANGNAACFDFPEESRRRNVTVEELSEELIARISDQSIITQQKKVLLEHLFDQKKQKALQFTMEVVEGKEQILRTDTARFTLFCTAKIFAINNATMIISSAALAIIVIITTYIALHRAKKMKIGREIYGDLLRMLETSTDHTLNVSEQKDAILAKHKFNFGEDIWLIVDRIRFSEAKVQVYRDFDGLYWSLL